VRFLKQFSGSFEHKLDHKGKVSIPNKFRRELDDKVMLTLGTDDVYVWVFPPAVWEQLVAKISALPNNKQAKRVRRFLLGNAHEAPVDRVGRIQIPQALRERAGIDNKSVFIVGVGDSIEIWEKERKEKQDTHFIKESGFENDLEEADIQKDMEDLGI
jgi:MraZ protein